MITPDEFRDRRVVTSPTRNRRDGTGQRAGASTFINPSRALEGGVRPGEIRLGGLERSAPAPALSLAAWEAADRLGKRERGPKCVSGEPERWRATSLGRRFTRVSASLPSVLENPSEPIKPNRGNIPAQGSPGVPSVMGAGGVPHTARDWAPALGGRGRQAGADKGSAARKCWFFCGLQDWSTVFEGSVESIRAHSASGRPARSEKHAMAPFVDCRQRHQTRICVQWARDDRGEPRLGDAGNQEYSAAKIPGLVRFLFSLISPCRGPSTGKEARSQMWSGQRPEAERVPTRLCVEFELLGSFSS